MMPPVPDSARRERFLTLGFGSLLVLLGLLHVAAVFTENVNWDEFAVFRRTADMLRTGQVQGGGRPGLVELVLAPFVLGCVDAVAVVRSARLFWVALTAGALGGLYLLLLRLRRRSPHPWHGAAAGLALLVLVPVFLRWSLQVRTDQAALFCGLWGGVALLASARRRSWAFPAGLAFAVGFLFSQKLVYVASLMGLLALWDGWGQVSEGESRHARLKRDAHRLLLLLAGAALVFLLYGKGVALYLKLPRPVSLEGGLASFAYYREVFGFRAYRGMLPTLIPHLVFLALLIRATLQLPPGHSRRELALPWAVLALGLAVGLFHAGAFPYFWIILGIFPAIAFALAYELLADALPTRRIRVLVMGGSWVLLIASGISSASGLLQDTQAVQRESLAFVEKNFPPTASGFHAEGALFCRQDPEPFPVYFSETIQRTFGGPDRQANIVRMKQEFQRRPVEFIVSTHVFNQFPEELRLLWAQHYQTYRGRVLVPARRLVGKRGTRQTLEVLIPGAYRWQMPEELPAATIAINGKAVAVGEVLTLRSGQHTIDFLEDVPAGLLVRAVQSEPDPSPEPFYSADAILEIVGRQAWWN